MKVRWHHAVLACVLPSATALLGPLAARTSGANASTWIGANGTSASAVSIALVLRNGAANVPHETVAERVDRQMREIDEMGFPEPNVSGKRAAQEPRNAAALSEGNSEENSAKDARRRHFKRHDFTAEVVLFVFMLLVVAALLRGTLL